MQIRERIRMKKLFIGLGIFIVAVAIILVIAVKVFVDEKVIKENIVTQVNNTTQHTMAIDGELTLNFYPKIGFSISDVSFYNKPEFSDEKMFALKNVSVAIDVMSLFSDTIVVDQVSVDGLLANVETLKDERNNIQALLDNVSPAKESISTEDVGAIKVNKAGEVEENKYQIIIGDILIHDANVTLKNQIDNSFHQLSNVNLNVSEFSFDSPVSVALDAKYISNELAVKLDLTTMLLVDKAIKHIALTRFNNQIELKGAGLPKPKINVSIASDIRFDAEYKLVNIDNLKLAVDEITVEGNLSADVFAKPQLKYELSVNAVNVNDWLPKAGSDADDHTAKSNSETKSASAKVESEVEPDLSALSAFNQKGTLTIEKVLFDAYEVDNILINSELSQGIFNLYKLKADLYEGDITIKARLNSTETPAMFSVNSRVNQVQSEQLVTIASGKKLITGFVDSAIQIKGQGLTQTKLKSKTTGTIHTSFSNGAVLGVNVAQKIREAIGKFTGEYKESANQTNNTDFSSLIANFQLGKGKLKSTEISLHSPAVKIDGKGQVDIIRENIDFNFGAYLSEAIGGKNSSTMKSVRNLRFPVDIKGPFTAPQIKFDTSELAKQVLKSKEDKLKKSAEKRLDKLLGDDPEKQKIKDEIFKGLDKWLK